MPHLPIIAALFLNGPAPDAGNAKDPAWFSLTEIERIVYASSSLRDEENEDFDSGQSEPTADAFGAFWAGGAEGKATLRPDAFAETGAIQLSGPANTGAFWSLGDVDLSMTASEPLLQSFTFGGSRMAFVFEVNVPTRVECFIHLVTEGSADSVAWTRLRAGTTPGAPYVYDELITSAELLIEESLTLPEGVYTLEAGARSEVFDVLGVTTAVSGFVVSFTPTDSCNASDIAEPLGTLDFADVNAFLVAFMHQQTDADLARPPMVYDMSDIIEFLVRFSAGCPD